MANLGPEFTHVTFGKPSSFDHIEFGDVSFYNVALTVADLGGLIEAHTRGCTYRARCPRPT